VASLPGDGLLCEPGEKLPGVLAPAAEGIERKGDKGGPRFLRGRAVFTAFGRFGVAERARGPGCSSRRAVGGDNTMLLPQPWCAADTALAGTVHIPMMDMSYQCLLAGGNLFARWRSEARVGLATRRPPPAGCGSPHCTVIIMMRSHLSHVVQQAQLLQAQSTHT